MRIGIILLILGLCSCKKRPRPTFPIIHLNIALDSIPDEGKSGCVALLSDQKEDVRIKTGIEYRGSASRKFPKRSFSLHIRNKGNAIPEWQGLSLQGDWVLYAPYADRTCLRNRLAQELFHQLGHYSPKSIFTELTIDTNYLGLYEWREKISLTTGRVPEAPCLLKFDKATAKRSKQEKSILNPLVSIRFHDSQAGYPVDSAFRAVSRFENALLQKNNEWEKYADKNSFVDFFLFTELANSPDAYRSSCYFQILPDGRLRMGPVWDFDLAFGNSTLFRAEETSDWRFRFNEADSFKNLAAPPWWSNLYARADFRQALIVRWKSLRSSSLSDSVISKQIDKLVAEIEPVVEKNHAKWQVMQRTILWTVPAQKNYNEEIHKLKSWISQRAHWIENELRN
ncbi:MAG: CotH kinase family protein [Bacteroidota bacterium]